MFTLMEKWDDSFIHEDKHPNLNTFTHYFHQRMPIQMKLIDIKFSTSFASSNYANRIIYFWEHFQCDGEHQEFQFYYVCVFIENAKNI